MIEERGVRRTRAVHTVAAALGQRLDEVLL
jgi:hypothetical protein